MQGRPCPLTNKCPQCQYPICLCLDTVMNSERSLLNLALTSIEISKWLSDYLNTEKKYFGRFWLEKGTIAISSRCSRSVIPLCIVILVARWIPTSQILSAERQSCANVGNNRWNPAQNVSVQKRLSHPKVIHVSMFSVFRFLFKHEMKTMAKCLSMLLFLRSKWLPCPNIVHTYMYKWNMITKTNVVQVFQSSCANGIHIHMFKCKNNHSLCRKDIDLQISICPQCPNVSVQKPPSINVISAQIFQ